MGNGEGTTLPCWGEIIMVMMIMVLLQLIILLDLLDLGAQDGVSVPSPMR